MGFIYSYCFERSPNIWYGDISRNGQHRKVVVCSADVVVLNSVVGLSTHGNNPLLSRCVQRDKHRVSCSAYVVDFVLSIQQQSGLELSVVMLCSESR